MLLRSKALEYTENHALRIGTATLEKEVNSKTILSLAPGPSKLCPIKKCLPCPLKRDHSNIFYTSLACIWDTDVAN